MIDCLIVINRNFMRRKSFITLLVLIVFLFLPFFTKAQLDTAYIQSVYSNQYIYPYLMDTNYTSIRTLACEQAEPISSPFGLSIHSTVSNQHLLTGFAQRYEVTDSVDIMGVALMVQGSVGLNSWPSLLIIQVSVWDSTMTSMIYSQQYIDGGMVNNYQRPATTSYPFIEFIFDDTLTLYEDYHIAFSYPKRCEEFMTSVPLFMTLSDYALQVVDPYSDYCTPYGICTKYKPYVMFGCEGERSWLHVDSVTYQGSQNYHKIARYQNYQENLIYPDLPVCDSVVYKAIGICPIKALENSIITDNDSTSTGGGSTGTGDDSTSTGGGSQDSYIATVLADEDIELYPNPADEVLNIRSDYNITEIDVIDAMNRVIERWELNSRELTLDVASYKSGTYFIIIKTDKGSLTKKFIVR